MSDMETDEEKKDEVYSSGEEGAQTVMSERVSNMANSIYSEFERMIQKYDQDVVSGLMPLMVSVLEQLDSAYSDNNEQLLELEMLSDDNEQLITQYEREKQLRKLAEKRYLEIEDQVEADQRNVENNIDALTHENKGLENRVKSYQDHGNNSIEIHDLISGTGQNLEGEGRGGGLVQMVEGSLYLMRYKREGQKDLSKSLRGGPKFFCAKKAIILSKYIKQGPCRSLNP
ncbi:C-Jun-amino-terminal kinase-interacting protein 4 [Exaiptasia diaphana]|nr:C-Jun-amino-terminal kinase-interacting protein 4 [Exaiptasia diaphana]